MATVSGVWKWNNQIGNFAPSGTAQEVYVNFSCEGYSPFTHIYFENKPADGFILMGYYREEGAGFSTYDGITNTWLNESVKTIDFGSTEQTVSETFYTFLTSNATQQASPSVPTPDWANCFVKTSAGNKAVQKVWIKQNGQLVTVYDGGGGGAAVNFATDSWETISAACKDGSYKTVYQVGDTKDIELSTGETITVVIMGFDHDDLSDGSGKAPITVAMENLLATKYQMNSTNTNAGGWNDCLMRTSTMSTLLSQFPSDLQSVIKQVNKKATSGSASTTITTSNDKLFLFSEVEIDGTTSSGYASEGEQYEYWKTVKDGKTSADRIKYLSNGDGSANIWWLRSPHINGSSSFQCIFSRGTVNSNIASGSTGICFGFCVG